MQKYFWGILIVLLVGFGAWYFSSIVVYVLVAAILSLIGQPIDRFYSKLRIGKFKLSMSVSAGLAFLTLFLIFFLLARFFMPLVAEEAQIISSIDGETAMASLRQPIDQFEKFLAGFNPEYERGTLEMYLREKMVSVLTITNLSEFFNGIINALGDFVVAFFAISFLTFFFLRDEDKIIDTMLLAFPESYTDRVRNVLKESEKMLKRYFIGVLVEMLLVVALLSIGLSVAGIEHAMLIALFAGIVNVIPYVGPLIGAGFALFIGLTTNPDMATTLIIVKILVIFPIVNLMDAFLLQPFIYSSSVKAHPLEIFLVILAGATVGGIPGMLLAVPSYTILRVIAKEFFVNFRLVKRMTDKFGSQ